MRTRKGRVPENAGIADRIPNAERRTPNVGPGGPCVARFGHAWRVTPDAVNGGAAGGSGRSTEGAGRGHALSIPGRPVRPRSSVAAPGFGSSCVSPLGSGVSSTRLAIPPAVRAPMTVTKNLGHPGPASEAAAGRVSRPTANRMATRIRRKPYPSESQAVHQRTGIVASGTSRAHPGGRPRAIDATGMSASPRN